MAYEYEVDGKVYKLQTANIYSPSSKKDIPVYVFREELISGYEFLDELPENKTIDVNKVTRVPYVVSKIKVTPIPKPNEDR